VVSRDGQAVRLQATVGGVVAGGAGGAVREDPWLARLPSLLDGGIPAGPARAALPADGRLLVMPLALGRLGPNGSLVFARDEEAGGSTQRTWPGYNAGRSPERRRRRAIAYQRDHEFAGTFLDALLVTRRSCPGWMRACGAWASHLHHGGDFYDFVKLREGRLMVVIGDLCGKGYHQQAVIAKLRYMLRAYAAEGSPGESLSRLNAALLAQEVETPLTTLVVGYLDITTRLFEFAVAGHPRPLILGGRDEVPCSKSGSYPVGIFPTVYETNRVILPQSDGGYCAAVHRSPQREGLLRRAAAAERRALLPRQAGEGHRLDLIERVRRYAR
jgi:hypothetical protein